MRLGLGSRFSNFRGDSKCEHPTTPKLRKHFIETASKHIGCSTSDEK